MICNRCNIEKSLDSFSLKKSTKTGYNTICKDCIKDYNSKYYKLNKKKLKEKSLTYYNLNRDSINANRKGVVKINYYLLNKERIDNYYYKNREEILERVKKYRKNNRDKINTYISNRKKNDPNFLISLVLRNRFSKVIKEIYTGSKTDKSKELLNCSIEDFKKHIENLFTENMNWENHGNKGWHFDHIIPIFSFDLTLEEEVKKCFNYSNIQPLWWYDNLKKGNKVLTNN